MIENVSPRSTATPLPHGPSTSGAPGPLVRRGRLDAEVVAAAPGTAEGRGGGTTIALGAPVSGDPGVPLPQAATQAHASQRRATLAEHSIADRDCSSPFRGPSVS